MTSVAQRFPGFSKLVLVWEIWKDTRSEFRSGTYSTRNSALWNQAIGVVVWIHYFLLNTAPDLGVNLSFQYLVPRKQY